MHQFIERKISQFRKEYRKVYDNILPLEVLAKGNPWFESFLATSLTELVEEIRGKLPQEKEQLDKNDPDNYWGGVGGCWVLASFSSPPSCFAMSWFFNYTVR